jgi:hypothetical protein
MDEMIVTPDGGVIIVLPLQVDIQVGQMITLRNSKLLPYLITLLLSALGREKGLSSRAWGSPGPWMLTQNFKHINMLPSNIEEIDIIYNKIC